MLERKARGESYAADGPKAVQEAIDMVKNMKPLPALKRSNGLAKSARDHAIDTNKNKIHGHKGSDGSSHADRIKRYVSNPGAMSENIQYGIKDPKNIILAFLMDISVLNRAHRKTILSPNYKFAGVSVLSDGSPNGIVTVIDYSGN